MVCGMCPSRTSPRAPASCAHVETHVRVVQVHTVDVSNGHTGGRRGEEVRVVRRGIVTSLVFFHR